MGHGQCGCNHCAITSSAFDQDDATVNPLDLPMIHLFVDDAAKSKSKADKMSLLESAVVGTEDLLDRGYLTLVFDGKALRYLLNQRWDRRGTVMLKDDDDDDSKEPVAPKLVEGVHDLMFCLRPNFPESLEKCTSFITKLFATTSLKVNEEKLQIISTKVMAFHATHSVDDVAGMKREIKKWMTHNKRRPFSKEKWVKVLREKLMITKHVKEMAEWAQDMVTAKWSVQEDFKAFLGEKEFVEWLRSGSETLSLLGHLVKCGEAKEFGARRGRVVIGVERDVMAKCEDREACWKLLEESVEKDVLKMVDLSKMKPSNVRVVTYREKELQGRLSVSRIHRKLRATPKKTMWNRKFFEAL